MKKSTRELIDYGIWGVATVAFNMLSYLFFKLFMPYQFANLFSIITTKIFAYFVNKLFVFSYKKQLYRNDERDVSLYTCQGIDWSFGLFWINCAC